MSEFRRRLMMQIRSGELPEGYTRLFALQPNANSTYIDLGDAWDTQSQWDLFFAPYASAGSGQVLAGLRRASGTGDSLANGFYFKTSSWSAVAWVVGGTDSGYPPARGQGAIFSYNVQKLSQRGKSLYVYDRLIGNTDREYTSDGLTAVYGNLRKSATAMYNSARCGCVFIRYTSYNASGNKIKDLLPCISPENKYGVYDIINKTFTEAYNQSGWIALPMETIPYHSLRIGAMVKNGNNPYPHSTNSMQTANYYKGYVVTTHNLQREFTVVKGELTFKGNSVNESYLEYPSQQLLICSRYNTNWHGNTSWFSEQKYSPEDYFPLLYVGTDKGNNKLCVYRLKGSNPDALESVELVQEINTPRDTTLYFNNYYGLHGIAQFVRVGYTQDSYSSSADNNHLVADIYEIPDINAGAEITIDESRIVKSIELGFENTTSDGWYNGKYLVITFADRVVAWDLTEAAPKPIVIFDDIVGNGKYSVTSSEIEGIKPAYGEEFFTLAHEPSTGRIDYLFADDLKMYRDIR